MSSNTSQEFATTITNLRNLYVAVFGEGAEERGVLSNAEDAIVIRGIVSDVLMTISPREERVIRMRFGINRTAKVYTQVAVADDFSVSRERIRQIERKALRKLRHPSRARALQAVAQSVGNPDLVEELHLGWLSLTEIPSFLAKFRNVRSLSP
jgi:DNA-binding CsgD family transcriptional regulator